MPHLSTPAIMIRRLDFGDYDLILTFLTLNQGKLTVIAKSAKKSVKRFGGLLELFYVLDMVCSRSRREKMPVLTEVSLKQPFDAIRSNVTKTAYASYWSQLVADWLEEGCRQIDIYRLLEFVLSQLNAGRIDADVLSILFQLHFMRLSGHQPNLSHCSRCHLDLSGFSGSQLFFDLKSGGLVCGQCQSIAAGPIRLSKSTVLQMQWLAKSDLTKASRVKLSTQAVKESLTVLETFVPYHLGSDPKSLKFLKQIRNS